MRFDDTIITISREYGSGGRIIGQRLAQELGIAFYDNELITMAASQTGMSEDFLKKTEERANHSLRFSLSYLGNLSYTMPLNDKVFIAQSQIIRELAEKGPCVIVGRCADYVLKEHKHCINVFIHADIDYRMYRAIKHDDFPEQKTPEKTKEMILKIDKQRETYYNYYTDQAWGRADNYHLCLDSTKLHIDGTINVLKNYIDAFEQYCEE